MRGEGKRMTAPEPETPMAAPKERIGKYRVHPVASMFPMSERTRNSDRTLKLIRGIATNPPFQN
jgi:hypothetical protein